MFDRQNLESTDTVMLRATGIHKFYGESHVLKGVDLQVHRGEVLCIVGPSGSGKTTFLRCLNQLEEHQSGVIEICGEAIGHEIHRGKIYRQRERDLARLRKRIGFVFQSFELFAHMNALDNVAYGPINTLKVDKHVARQNARDLLDQVGLSDKYGSHPHSLSGGQQQRVAIARALAMKPAIILFDEPTSALDSESVAEVLAVMNNVAKQGMTMIVVTHELAFARSVADTMMLMEHGEVVECGPCLQVMDSPATDRARQFFQRPASDLRLHA